MPKLTKRFIDAQEPRVDDYFIFDDEVSGFAIRILPTGKKAFYIQYRLGGRTRRLKIGNYSTITVEYARQLAKVNLGRIANGADPVQELQDRRRAPTIKDICKRFDEEHISQHLKPSTQADYRRSIKLFILPNLGAMKVADVSRADISALHHKMRSTPYQANRVLGVLSKLFNLCELWCLRPDGSNPCRLIQKNKETKKERFLSHEELAQLNMAFNDALVERTESEHVVAAFKLLLLTGCRLSEIQKARWDYIYNGYLNLPDSKTGAKRVPLSDAAFAILQRLPREPGNPYIIIGKVPGQHITDLQRPWRRIRERAGLQDVRIHDLRHTYASHAVMNDVPIATVAKILGHSQLQTTMRYAHLADSEVRNSANAVSNILANPRVSPLGTPPMGSTAMGMPAPPLGAPPMERQLDRTPHLRVVK